MNSVDQHPSIELMEKLAAVFENNNVVPVRLPIQDLTARAREIHLMTEVSDELSAIRQFVDTVSNEYLALLNTNAANAVANDAALARLSQNFHASLDLLTELLDRGYGRVVTVRTEKGAIRKYRIAQANRSVIKGEDGRELMVVNRLAPVASVLVSAVVGDELELPNIGEVEVISVDNLDRSLTSERDDFSRIEFFHENLDGASSLDQLRSSFNAWLERWRSVCNLAEVYRHEALSESESRSVQTAEYVPEEISLGSSFYTRTTQAQEELVKRLRGGLVVVEGIAGSGKTSVALGRLKALHDSQFGYYEDGEEQQDLFFNNKSEMVGFVRHAQLIEYLKSAIDDLKLSGIPVKEFKELQNQLALQRAQILQLKLPAAKGGRYLRAQEPTRTQDFEGRMEWLKIVERSIRAIYLDQIRQRLNSMNGWVDQISDKAYYLEDREVGEVDFQKLLAIAWQRAAIEIDKFIASASSDPRTFALDRLVVKIKTAYDRIYDLVEDRSVWYLDETKAWHIDCPDGYKGVGSKPFYGANYDGRFASQLKNIRDKFREQVRRVLHADSGDDGRWLPRLSDWYRKALDCSDVCQFAEKAELDVIRRRLDAAQLIGVDINLLLAISQIMSRGHLYRDDDQRRLVAALATPRLYSSVFVDEVQDFCEIEVFLMASVANPERGAVTVVGDFKQQLYGGTVRNLSACFPYAQKSELEPAKLNENKRQLPNLAKFSSNFRRIIGDTSIAQAVVPENIPELSHNRVSELELGELIGSVVGSIPNTKSIAIISPTPEMAAKVEKQARPFVGIHFRETKFSSDNRDLVKRIYVHFTDPRPTKGLEFDVVIVTHFNQFNLDDKLAAHGAYVAVSRPREKLVLVDVI